MKRLILFLIRRRLGLKKFEYFQFTNQKTDNIYYFADEELVKMESVPNHDYALMSANVSLNWLLNDECEIRKLAE